MKKKFIFLFLILSVFFSSFCFKVKASELTDLSNTTWLFNDTISSLSSSYTINIEASGLSENYIYSGLAWKTPNGENDLHGLYLLSANGSFDEQIYSSAFNFWLYTDKKITIVGGTDVKNNSLISYLQSNATLIVEEEEEITVTDLTNTTWYVASNWECDSRYGRYQLLGKVYKGDQVENLTENNEFCIGYHSVTEPFNQTVKENVVSVYDRFGSGMDNLDITPSNCFYISITGGIDATNTSLILWLNNNGKQVNKRLLSLDGATVTVPSGWTASAGYGIFSFNGYGNIDGYPLEGGSHFQDQSSINSFRIGYSGNFDGDFSQKANKIWFGNFGDIGNTSEFAIKIIDGKDITNPSLIQWLVDNNATIEGGVWENFSCGYNINFVVRYNDVELRKLDSFTNFNSIPLELPNPDKDDYLTFYNFEGWYYDQEFKNKVNENDVLTSDITLYAKITPLKYTLSFVTNTDYITLDPVEISIDTLMSISNLPILFSERFDFVGWYYEPTFETQVNETDCLTENTTIYALLENIKYKLSYVTGLEEYDSYYINSIYTDKIVYPTWTYESICCDYWYFDEERTIEATPGFLLMEDTILYAHTYHNSYTITFDSKGGTDVEPYVSTKIFSELNSPVPLKKGYIFVGWYYDNYSFNESVIYNDLLTTDIILYAKWEKEKYNLQFFTDGSPLEIYNVGYFPNPTPVSVKSGYIFEGWYYDEDYTSKVLPGDEINEDTNVYAKFRLSYNGVIDDITDGNSISEETLQYIIIFSILGFIVIKILKRR